MQNITRVFMVKNAKLSGTDYKEVYKKSFGAYKVIKKRTRRRPYVRSVYFNKEKIFLELFWHHIHSKENHRDKIRRMRYFPCAVELIQRSRLDPESKENPNKRSEILHRFTGETREGDIFFVQIKEEKKSGRKWLISVFPAYKRKKTPR